MCATSYTFDSTLPGVITVRQQAQYGALANCLGPVVDAELAHDDLQVVFDRGGADLQDLGDFLAVNEVYGGFFVASPPARATVQVAGLPRGALVEIDAILHAG